MPGLTFILLLTFMSLVVLLWAGTYYFQGYIYTEPSPGIFWQAPAAAFLLTFGFAIWTFSLALGSRSSPTFRPVDTLIRFNPREEMLDRPAPRIYALRAEKAKPGEFKEPKKTLYVSKRDGTNLFHYEDTSIRPRPWQPEGVVALEVVMKSAKDEESTLRFDFVPGERGTYGYFTGPDGWIIEVDKNFAPTGIPVKFNFLLLIVNLIFNFGHFVGWFLALWVILRFQWTHALGLAFVIWLAFTIIVVPMLLGYAGEVAVARQTRTALISVYQQHL